MLLTNVLGPAAADPRRTSPTSPPSSGRIVLVGSVAGLLHTPGNIYGATKWALTGLAGNTRQLVERPRGRRHAGLTGRHRGP